MTGGEMTGGKMTGAKMTGDWPDFETLNAYVDGELTPDAAADVAKALAGDPQKAEQVALLTRLKASVRTSVQTSVLGSLAEEPIALPARPAGRKRLGAVAASIAAAVLLGLAAFAFWPGAPDDPAVALADRAWAKHRDWALTEPYYGPPTSALVLAAKGRLGDSALIADLGSAGLTLDSLKWSTGPGGADVLHLRYTGTRGCRVSLFLMPAGDRLSAELAAIADSRAMAYAWRAGPIDYVLLADGMDPTRLALIARSVWRASLDRVPFDAETRTALHRNRQQSRRCLA